MKPLLRWAGGKSRLIPTILQHLPPIASFDSYHEPFLGGGALFWHLREEYRLESHLGESNHQLVNFMSALRDQPANLETAMADHSRDHCEDHYAVVRDQFNSQIQGAVDRAATFWYLNQAGFNGLWRVNKKGLYNVPSGKRARVTCPDISGHSRAAQDVVLYADFALCLEGAGEGALVYCDPPYDKVTDTSFTGYGPAGFGFPEQDRLLAACQAAAQRGATVLISNADTPTMRDLYEGHLVYDVTGHRAIAADKTKRGGVGELLVRVVA